MNKSVISIKEEIENIINIYLMNSFGIVLIQHPHGKIAIEKIFPSGKNELGFRKKSDNIRKMYDLDEELKIFRDHPKNNVKFLVYPLMSTTILIHDLLKYNQLLKHTPEFEFLRHLRNAFSHGNKFYFLNHEPSRVAKFKNFQITKKMDGKENILCEYLNIGDVLDLLEFVKNNI